jgi:hypothetical protein
MNKSPANPHTMKTSISNILRLQTVSGKPVYICGAWKYTTEQTYKTKFGEEKSRQPATSFVASSSEECRASNARKAAKDIGEQCEWVDTGESAKFFRL